MVWFSSCTNSNSDLAISYFRNGSIPGSPVAPVSAVPGVPGEVSAGALGVVVIGPLLLLVVAVLLVTLLVVWLLEVLVVVELGRPTPAEKPKASRIDTLPKAVVGT